MGRARLPVHQVEVRKVELLGIVAAQAHDLAEQQERDEEHEAAAVGVPEADDEREPAQHEQRRHRAEPEARPRISARKGRERYLFILFAPSCSPPVEGA